MGQQRLLQRKFQETEIILIEFEIVETLNPFLGLKSKLKMIGVSRRKTSVWEYGSVEGKISETQIMWGSKTQRWSKTIVRIGYQRNLLTYCEWVMHKQCYVGAIGVWPMFCVNWRSLGVVIWRHRLKYNWKFWLRLFPFLESQIVKCPLKERCVGIAEISRIKFLM